MKHRLIAFAAALFSLAALSSAQESRWSPAGNRIMTPWAKEVSPENVHTEYPRPQMVRENWKSLNGLWEYAVTDKLAAEPERYEGEILVPFAIESALSGVGRAVTGQDAIWYKTAFTVPKGWNRVKLNFEAVDWKAEVFVGGVQVGTHTGGYTHFSFDITPYVKKGSVNTLVLKVTDATDNDFQPRGKQVSRPGGIWYTAVSGIWQSVWMESVSATCVEDYYAVSNIHDRTVDVSVSVAGAQAGDVVRIALLDGGVGYSTENQPHEFVQVVSRADAAPGVTVTLPVPDMQLWSPDSPYLYGLDISILRGKVTLDRVKGYTAMREISVGKSRNGVKLMALNGKNLFQFGPLDQGWWPDGLYTAPTDEALKFDIQKTKDFGFNMIRKHIKVEPSRWYYYCDQLGMLVWQDMPSFSDNKQNIWGVHNYDEGTDFPATTLAKANFRKEWREIIDQTKKFPCIVVWVPFNEAWSQFDTREIVDFTRDLDPTRLINMASGGNWTRDCGDILDNHHYPYPAMRLWDRNMINVLGEYGGIGLAVEGHLWQPDRNWGYVQYKNAEEVLAEYENFAGQLIQLVTQGCAAAIYTQTTDCEIEVNGLMTYDRVVKLDEARLREINTRVIESME
ncbi:MAG: beta-galactosidase [Bacteroidales bacterium]|jgi:beta-galactosidase/beta-glucuronidase|nr:beta-galactosidase [Bacteroidales bacterium]